MPDQTTQLVFMLEKAWYYDRPRQWERVYDPHTDAFAACALRERRAALARGEEVEVWRERTGDRYVFRFVRVPSFGPADWAPPLDAPVEAVR